MAIQPALVPEVHWCRHFKCPCGHDELHRFDYLHEGREVGPWYCHGCGVGWFITLLDGTPVLRDRGHRIAHVLVRLRLALAEGQTLDLVVTHRLFRQDGVVPTAADYDEDAADFLYDEHQCPTNILHDAKEAYLDGEQDPHGIFDIVGLEQPEPEAPK